MLYYFVMLVTRGGMSALIIVPLVAFVVLSSYVGFKSTRLAITPDGILICGRIRTQRLIHWRQFLGVQYTVDFWSGQGLRMIFEDRELLLSRYLGQKFDETEVADALYAAKQRYDPIGRTVKRIMTAKEWKRVQRGEY